jgi:hypothetical protein
MERNAGRGHDARESEFLMDPIEHDYVLIQHLISKPGKPLTSSPNSMDLIKDMQLRFSRDRLAITMPLFFHLHPSGTSAPAGAPAPAMAVERSDLNGSPRITLAQRQRTAGA